MLEQPPNTSGVINAIIIARIIIFFIFKPLFLSNSNSFLWLIKYSLFDLRESKVVIPFGDHFLIDMFFILNTPYCFVIEITISLP